MCGCKRGCKIDGVECSGKNLFYDLISERETKKNAANALAKGFLSNNYLIRRQKNIKYEKIIINNSNWYISDMASI